MEEDDGKSMSAGITIGLSLITSACVSVQSEFVFMQNLSIITVNLILNIIYGSELISPRFVINQDLDFI